MKDLVFIDRRSDIRTPAPNSLVVVLDPAWTPGPDDPPSLRPIRELFSRIVARHNLFDESLARLDAWAAASGAVDRFSAGGVTWWFHARGFLRLDVHEMLIWLHVLEELASDGPFKRIAIPAGHTALAEVVRARASSDGPRVVSHRGFVTPAVLASERLRSAATLLMRIRRRAKLTLDPRSIPRARRLARRIAAHAARQGAILGLVRGPSYHVIDDPSGTKRDDPYVGPVLRRLAATGRTVVRVGIGIDHRRDPDWDLIRDDDDLIPMSMVERQFPPTASERREATRLASAIATLQPVTLRVGEVDLGPAFTRRAAKQARWFRRQRLAMCSAERFVAHLGIAVVLTGWESARTSWLGAAHRLGVPSVAVQHGVIYPNTPDYCRPAHPALVKPDVTCVFGDYERDLLIREGGYAPPAVEATGSPRADPDRTIVDISPTERAELRRSLGVAEGDRMLVLSTARHTIGDAVHSMAMVGRLLDGPLPGVHIVFKIHPEEEERDQYEELLAGLARAGGYPATRMSRIRDIDLYRLLRSADAHLGQYSTVLTDAVLTGTPNMIAVGQAWSDPLGHVEAGVAVPVRSVDEVRAFMDAPQPPSPEARSAFLEAHYRSGDAVARIATTIERVASR
ncbi:MAG: hypothetical protein ACHQ15_05380 [Candidatus Limnocylindrales bacterium]